MWKNEESDHRTPSNTVGASDGDHIVKKKSQIVKRTRYEETCQICCGVGPKNHRVQSDDGGAVSITVGADRISIDRRMSLSLVSKDHYCGIN